MSYIEHQGDCTAGDCTAVQWAHSAVSETKAIYVTVVFSCTASLGVRPTRTGHGCYDLYVA